MPVKQYATISDLVPRASKPASKPAKRTSSTPSSFPSKPSKDKGPTKTQMAIQQNPPIFTESTPSSTGSYISDSDRFTGTLREWFSHLSEYQQLQFVQLGSITQALAQIHQQFLGDYNLIFRQRKQEYFDRKCCSMKRKDLEVHYVHMSKLYYELAGPNSDDLKYTFVSSLPEEMHPEIQRMMTETHRDITHISLGEIWQFTLATLDKMCEQQKLFKKIAKGEALLRNLCNRDYLQIKCKEKHCDCRSKKKKHFSSHSKESSHYKQRKGRKIRWFKRKSTNKRKSDRCYICGQRGHYAKKCPNKPNQTVALLHQLKDSCPEDLSDHDLESLFSEEEMASSQTLFAIPYSDNSTDDENSSDEETSILTIGPADVEKE
ncbi:uncharacterized protein LOC125369772 [Ricinus communis]|uniref:uncharacterized protein LOC125369772 n=1 Tax=Ricinus communis TaxID=3988 RepID=UPI00201AA88A|nr:uncharacterized protein LOC125369772 [Ricinus communis]